MPLGPFGTVTPDSPPTIRPGVQSADGHYLLDSRVPPEHPERQMKGDLTMFPVDMPSRPSYENAKLVGGGSWDANGMPVPADTVPFTIGVKAATRADKSDVPKGTKFQSGLPMTSRVEKRRK